MRLSQDHGPGRLGFAHSFPLFPDVQYDASTNPEYGDMIGFCHEYPRDLKERVVAARVSYRLQCGVDYALKKYVRQTDGKGAAEGSGDRLDHTLQSECLNSIRENLRVVWSHNRDRQSAQLGLGLADAAFAKANYSVEVAFRLANTGALFESLSVARMVVEQLAWACRVCKMTDADAIKRIRAEASLAALRAPFPMVGPYYGWLSEHSHWAYDAHEPALEFGDEEGAGVMLRSVKFKVEAMAALAVLSELYVKALAFVHSDLQVTPAVCSFEMIDRIVQSAQNRDELSTCAVALLRLKEIAARSDMRS